MNIIEQLKKHEGFSGTVYQCTAGANTIGYGRNLDAKPLTEEEAEQLLINDVFDVELALQKKLEFLQFEPRISAARHAVLVNMAFNIGITGLLKFKKTLEAIKERDYETASIEMLDSKWAKQVGSRATELAEQMKTGKWQL